MHIKNFGIFGIYRVQTVPMKGIFFIILFESAFKMIKNGVYFIVIALLVAELFKILIHTN